MRDLEVEKRNMDARETEEVPLQVTVPPRVKRELDVLAATVGRTKRSIVLEALRTVGVSTTDAEIAGRRPKRGRKGTKITDG